MTPLEWVAVAALIIGVVGSLASATTAVMAGNEAKKQGEYNAKVLAEQAKAEQQKADYEASLLKRNAEKLKARQRHAYLSSGVDVSEGTPLIVMSEQAKELEMDAMAIRYGGNVEAARARQAAKYSKYQGSAAQRAGYWNAGSSLLTGMGRAASSASSFKDGSKDTVLDVEYKG
jgi:hypothetical protein